MKTRQEVVASDYMQKNYHYLRSAPVGKQFDEDFRPDLTPSEMLAMGIFGGRYMRDCINEFPKSWFTHARFHPQGEAGDSPELNYFGVAASQSLAVWRKKGWINEEHDPRGWFQWYCRYYMGRRLPEEDKRQIKRWKAMRRHLAQIAQHCRPRDISCRKRQRQALLHWAYDSRNI